MFRRRHLTLGALVALALTGTALAAWVLLQGSITGNGGGTIGSPTTTVIGAVALTAKDPVSLDASCGLEPSGSSCIAYDANNPDTHTQTVTAASVGSLADNKGGTCVSHITAHPNVLVGQVFPPGISHPAPVAGFFTADATLPTTCANATLTASLSGTTSGS